MNSKDVSKLNVHCVESEGSYNGIIQCNVWIWVHRTELCTSRALPPPWSWRLNHCLLGQILFFIYTVVTIEIIMTPTIGKPGMLGELSLIITPDLMMD